MSRSTAKRCATSVRAAKLPRKNETYWYMNNAFLFDVDQARVLTTDGRQPVEVDEASVRRSVKLSEINDSHIDSVDVTAPGIIAHVFYTLPDGETVRGHLLIDGNHRAARCLKLNRPFLAFVLTEEESEAILLRHPNKPELAQT